MSPDSKPKIMESRVLPPPALVVFDLDGTLVDTAPDLSRCLEKVLSQLGLPLREEAEVQEWIGNGIERLLHRAVTGHMNGQACPDLHAKAWQLFAECYDANINTYSRVYKGAREAIVTLRAANIPLACITNKISRFAFPLLRSLGLMDCFDLVLAGDSLPKKKPDPEPLLHAARHFQVSPDRCWMVGDSMNDVIAGRAAGFHVVCVSYGYNHGEDIRLASPDAVVDSLANLFPGCLQS
ncbi:Phosphoglycolate phosphatase [Gammaproteobacteria bacterium]